MDDKDISSIAKVLKANGISVGPISLTRLAGDASLRQYFRVTSPSFGKKSYVVMKMAKGFNSLAEEITKTSPGLTEHPFLNVQRFLKDNGIPVPEILGFDEKAAMIVLEDLGDASLYSIYNQLDPDRKRKIYSGLVERLIDMQTSEPGSKGCIGFHRKYDKEMCMWELNHFLEYGIEAFLGIKISSIERKIMDGFFKNIALTFLNEPFYLNHRDYHSKNVMMTGGDSFKIIDFQDAIMGPYQYDLASLLRDSYVTLDEALIAHLLDLYREEFLKSTGSKMGKEGLERSFDIISMHRNLKAAGRFVYIERIKKNPDYIKYIPRTMGYVRTNIRKYPEFEDSRELMEEYFTRIVDKALDYKEGG